MMYQLPEMAASGQTARAGLTLDYRAVRHTRRQLDVTHKPGLNQTKAAGLRRA